MEVIFVSLLSCNQLGWWDEQWGAGHPTPYPTHPFPSSLWRVLACSWREKFKKGIVVGKTLKSIHNHTELTGIWQIQVDISIFVICIRFMKGKTEHSQYVSNDMSQMSDNMCISCLPTAVPAYWDPRGLASFHLQLASFTCTYTWTLTALVNREAHKYMPSNLLHGNGSRKGSACVKTQ